MRRHLATSLYRLTSGSCMVSWPSRWPRSSHAGVTCAASLINAPAGPVGDFGGTRPPRHLLVSLGSTWNQRTPTHSQWGRPGELTDLGAMVMTPGLVRRRARLACVRALFASTTPFSSCLLASNVQQGLWGHRTCEGHYGPHNLYVAIITTTTSTATKSITSADDGR